MIDSLPTADSFPTAWEQIVQTLFARMQSASVRALAHVPHSVVEPAHEGDRIAARWPAGSLAIHFFQDPSLRTVWATIDVDGHAPYTMTPVEIGDPPAPGCEAAEQQLEQKLQEVLTRCFESATNVDHEWPDLSEA